MTPCGHELPYHQPDPIPCPTCGLWYTLATFTDHDLGTSWVGWTPMPGQSCHLCDGYGVLDGLERCPDCHGTGRQR